MKQPSSQDITTLLQAWGQGDQEALERLTPLVQDQLKKIAHNRLRRERKGHTLQSTEIIGELYLRLLGDQREWEGRAHFYAHCARLMHNILVDWARRRPRMLGVKNGVRVTMEDAIAVAVEEDNEIIQIHDALRDLKQFKPRWAEIVELKFFGGMTEEEIGTVLGFTSKTIQRDWQKARTWLKVQIRGALPDEIAAEIKAEIGAKIATNITSA
jgi:RNA polymerase sigma factor (TIGR02999 family)